MSAGFNHIHIAGEKVRLRPVSAADAAAAYKLVKNEAVLSTLAWDGPADEEEILNTYRRWEEEMKAIYLSRKKYCFDFGIFKKRVSWRCKTVLQNIIENNLLSET